MTLVTPCLLYEDVESALTFLTRVFGFVETLRYDDPAGYVSHAEMRHGKATIMLGDPGPDYRGPKRLGATTVQLHVDVDDVEAVHERAHEAGADITGERSFTATDPEGHVWTFGQTVRTVPAEEWGAVTPQGEGEAT